MEEDKKKSGKTEHGMRWYISLAVLVFVLFCCCTMFFFMIYRYNGVSKGWDTIMKVLQPITFGLVIAYLINPIMKFFENAFAAFLRTKSAEREEVQEDCKEYCNRWSGSCLCINCNPVVCHDDSAVNQ